MHVFAFAGADYTIICTQVLSMIILAFLANLIESILPKGKGLFGWLFYRCLSVVLAIFAHLAVDWLFRTYLPEGLFDRCIFADGVGLGLVCGLRGGVYFRLNRSLHRLLGDLLLEPVTRI
jgi:hypothetical protein